MILHILHDRLLWWLPLLSSTSTTAIGRFHRLVDDINFSVAPHTLHLILHIALWLLWWLLCSVHVTLWLQWLLRILHCPSLCLTSSAQVDLFSSVFDSCGPDQPQPVWCRCNAQATELLRLDLLTKVLHVRSNFTVGVGLVSKPSTWTSNWPLKPVTRRQPLHRPPFPAQCPPISQHVTLHRRQLGHDKVAPPGELLAFWWCPVTPGAHFQPATDQSELDPASDTGFWWLDPPLPPIHSPTCAHQIMMLCIALLDDMVNGLTWISNFLCFVYSVFVVIVRCPVHYSAWFFTSQSLPWTRCRRSNKI